MVNYLELQEIATSLKDMKEAVVAQIDNEEIPLRTRYNLIKLVKVTNSINRVAFGETDTEIADLKAKLPKLGKALQNERDAKKAKKAKRESA